MNIVIIKNGKKKTITQFAWDLMGENKNGWAVLEEKNQKVSNEVVTTKKEKAVTVEPSSKIITENASVKNEVDPKPVQKVSNELEPGEASNAKGTTEITSEIEIEPSKEFVDTALTIKRSLIKDYLDMKEVPFKQNATDLKLIGLVATLLKNDVELLKSEFGL